MRAEGVSPIPRQAGFTLVELMVASTLGLLLLAALGAVFLSASRSYRENDLVAGMQDQGRFALFTLSRDLAMAGYWGGVLGTDNLIPGLQDLDPDNDISSATEALAPTADCGPDGDPWSLRFGQAVQFRNQNSADSIASLWRCVGEHREGTDAFAVRHVAGQETGSMALGDSQVRLRPYHFYLQTNSTVGTLIRWGLEALAEPNALDQPATAPMRFYRYYPRIYYVRDHSIEAGDGIPTLCRKELCPTGYAAGEDDESASCAGGAGAPGALGYFSECVAEGVEDLQIVWGLDDPNDSDNIVDRYITDPSDEELATQARSAQIHLLMRSRRSDGQHLDQKTYRLADKPDFVPAAMSDPAGTPGDQQTRHFYRRLYSTTVQLRNLGIQGEGLAP